MPPQSPVPTAPSTPTTSKMSADQFAQSIKAKYPAYSKVDNSTLTQKMLAKYPQYSDRVDTSAPVTTEQKAPSTLTDKVLGGAQKVSDFLGGKGITDLVGGAIAKVANPENAKYVKMPTGKEVAGSALELGSLALPFGEVAKGGELALKGLGLGAKTAKLLGNVGSGALGGYGLDVGGKLQQDKSVPDALTPGAATITGAVLPVLPAIGRGIGKLSTESAGVSTGVGGGVTKQMFDSARAGGVDAATAKEALRGNTSPESIVEDARSALGTVIQNRTKAYQAQLGKLQTNTKEFDHTPVIDKFNTMLEDHGVTFDKKGAPDFTRSPGLGRYQKDLAGLSKVLSEWGTKPGDKTVLGIDKLKQVIDDFRIGSSDSRKFDSFVTGLRNEAKGLIKNEPGYDKLVKGYEDSTDLIKEVQRGLSLGDKAQTDTAFRKLSGALRVNNEFRKELIHELDAAVPGSPISSKIAGQQMSELLPRGIMRQLGGVGAIGGVLTGVGIVPLLKAALFTSPRAVGELLYGLGYTARQVDKIKSKLGGGSPFPGDVLMRTLPKIPGALR